MGNSCCASTESVPELTEQKGITKKEAVIVNEKLVVYGDWFSSDMRAVYAILQHSDVDFNFNLIDTLKNEQFSKSFTKISPGGHIPAFIKNG